MEEGGIEVLSDIVVVVGEGVVDGRGVIMVEDIEEDGDMGGF